VRPSPVLSVSLAGLFLVLFALVVALPSGSTGQPVRVAQAVACGGDSREVGVTVHRNRRLHINTEEISQEALRTRLADVFKTRVYRYVYVTADSDVPFRDVAEVIDLALMEMDYVSIATPSILRPALSMTGLCTDPNLPRSYLLDPTRRR
jgi:biopolymer transport protein ExbD